MSRHKVGCEEAQLTKWLPMTSLFVDENVQRRWNKSASEKIASEFNEDYLGVLHVSERNGDKFHTIDGQHRLRALEQKFGRNGTLVECKVYRGLSKAEEAALFVALNDSTKVTRIDTFLCSVIAKDSHAVAINAIAKESGFTINRNKSDNVITAVASLEGVYFQYFEKQIRKEAAADSDRDSRTNPELLRTVLSVIRKVWGGQGDSVNGHVISGLGRLLAARGRVMNHADFTQKLALYPGGPLALISNGSARRGITGGSISSNVAEICLDVYNKGRRAGKVDPLR